MSNPSTDAAILAAVAHESIDAIRLLLRVGVDTANSCRQLIAQGPAAADQAGAHLRAMQEMFLTIGQTRLPGEDGSRFGDGTPIYTDTTEDPPRRQYAQIPALGIRVEQGPEDQR